MNSLNTENVTEKEILNKKRQEETVKLLGEAIRQKYAKITEKEMKTYVLISIQYRISELYEEDRYDMETKLKFFNTYKEAKDFSENEVRGIKNTYPKNINTNTTEFIENISVEIDKVDVDKICHKKKFY